jgi:hypothetical protein
MDYLLQLDQTSYFHGKIVLRELYEQVFGIYNHLAKDKNPLAIVGLRKKESLTEGDPIDDLIGAYTNYDINGNFGLSFIEFVGLPSYVSTKLIKEATRIGEQAAKIKIPGLDKLKK